MGAGSSAEQQSPQDAAAAAVESQPSSPEADTPTTFEVVEPEQPEDPAKVRVSLSQCVPPKVGGGGGGRCVFLWQLRFTAQRKLSRGAQTPAPGRPGTCLPFSPARL